MTNDRQITISVGANRKSTQWHPQKIMISELYDRLRTPVRSIELIDDYLKLTKPQQDDLKDVGGFVAGTLRGPRRKGDAVTGRDAVVLDFDNIPAGGTDSFLQAVDGLGCGYCLYSTRKHRAAAPRLRVVIPLARTATADEYEPTARKMAEFIGIQHADPTTFEAARLMYWPSTCADGEYVYHTADRPLLDVEGLLRLYPDWRDTQAWPQVPGAAVSLPKLAAKQGDPEAKDGIIGAFCRTYDIYAAMDALLPGLYTPTDTPDRFTYAGGSTTGGAVVYDGGKFLYSHHATDPCGGKLVNAFDLVRLHKYDELDAASTSGTLAHQLPSYKAMCAFAKQIPEVDALLSQTRGEEILRAFDTAAPESTKTLAAYIGGLQGSTYTTEITRTLLGLLGIKTKLNEITWHVEVEGYPKAWSRANAENLLPVSLIDHLRLGGVRGATKGAICDSLDVIAEESRYNPVMEMLTGGAWDNRDRFGELYEIWGLNDQPFAQTLIRKWLLQCVAMACNDEIYPQGADGVLVPQGPQGIGKTSALRELVPLPRMFKEGARLDMREKDSFMQALNCWICELGELDRTTARDAAGLKAFITQDLDEYRTPYARKAVQRPRRTSFCGSVNPDDYLQDETGNRRFWTVPLERVDLPRLFALSDAWKIQMWQQAYAAYLAAPGEFRLTGTERDRLEAINSRHTKVLDFELELRELMKPELPREAWGEFSAVKIAALLPSRPPANKLGRILKKMCREDPRKELRTLHGRQVYRLPIANIYVAQEQGGASLDNPKVLHLR